MSHSPSFFEVLVPLLTVMLSTIILGVFIIYVDNHDNGLTSRFLCPLLGNDLILYFPLLT